MRNKGDTIAAIATPPGEGGIAIVRLSGEKAPGILKRMFAPKNPGAQFTHGQMHYGTILDAHGQRLDEAMAVCFYAPRSYTREDVCEIHTHGGVMSRLALEAAVELGARPADRGEFTYRAFLNGRLSLSRAEAVMGIIGAAGEESARRSARQLHFGASAGIGKCRSRLKEMVALIDAAADFPDEIDESVTAQRVKSEAGEILKELKRLCDRRYARMMSDGAQVVIAGRPNVGKSSLMNALLSFERSIVSDIPGTTRDAVSESVTLDGLRLTLTDTAGLRKSDDQIERLGVEITQKRLDGADVVILLLDAEKGMTEQDRALIEGADERYIIAYNKLDLKDAPDDRYPAVSAKTGEGIEALLQLVRKKLSLDEDDEKLLSLRHIDCAGRAIEALSEIVNAPEGTYLDLMLTDAMSALEALGEIDGLNVSQSVIDQIFESFCVGK